MQFSVNFFTWYFNNLPTSYILTYLHAVAQLLGTYPGALLEKRKSNDESKMDSILGLSG